MINEVRRVFFFLFFNFSQHVDYLIVQAEEVRIILPHLCFRFGDDLTYIPVWRRIKYHKLIRFRLMELTGLIPTGCSFWDSKLEFLPPRNRDETTECWNDPANEEKKHSSHATKTSHGNKVYFIFSHACESISIQLELSHLSHHQTLLLILGNLLH